MKNTNDLTPAEKRILAELMDGGYDLERNRFSTNAGWSYKRVVGDAPSKWDTEYVPVRPAQVDSLFKKGWLRKANNSIDRLEVVIPDDVDPVVAFPEIFPEEAAA